MCLYAYARRRGRRVITRHLAAMTSTSPLHITSYVDYHQSNDVTRQPGFLPSSGKPSAMFFEELRGELYRFLAKLF